EGGNSWRAERGISKSSDSSVILLQDPFADALEYYLATGKSALYYTRDDGYRRADSIGWYFTTYRDFWNIEKAALKFARGRVLDVGCGAGRHALYLQRKGLRVTAMDSSPRVAAIALARGVRDVRVASACERLPFGREEFDTVLLFGNNLGVCGSREGTARLLRELARVTKSKARILATTRAPGTFRSQHQAYWNQRLERGKEFGVIRLRLDFRGKSTREIDWFFIAPSALIELAWETGWRVVGVFGDGRADEGYSVVIEKRERRKTLI
ncbi:MAG TPA: class I SAM-dependent methyltransferase, partial [Anaerolineae bacterium]|nr:class I SAM-dependent methyltransferase [Anaerolineae bacterium]